jgi:hypothetical protein
MSSNKWYKDPFVSFLVARTSKMGAQCIITKNYPDFKLG